MTTVCRSHAEGGRRCTGHSSTREAQRARQQLCRARRALARVQSIGDPVALEQARERVLDAEDTVEATRILAGADRPDVPNAAGLRRAERIAVSDYAGGEFRSINEYVLNGYRLPDYAADDRDYVRYMQRKVAALTRAVNRSRLTAPTRAVRATWTLVADRAYGPVGSQVGKIVTENRFVSTTTNAEPDRAHGDVTITYWLAAGTRALDIEASGVPYTPGEHELLVGSHQSFVIVSDRIVNGERQIVQRSVRASTQAGPAIADDRRADAS